MGQDETAKASAEWTDPASVLLDGGKNHPEIVLPELANLAGDPNSGHIAAKDGYPPIFINAYTIDRERVRALFGDQAQNLLALFVSYDGENAWALRPKAEAERWLSELKT